MRIPLPGKQSLQGLLQALQRIDDQHGKSGPSKGQGTDAVKKAILQRLTTGWDDPKKKGVAI